MRSRPAFTGGGFLYAMKISPFYFEKISRNKYIVSNMFRKFMYFTPEQVEDFCAGNIPAGIADILRENMFIIDSEERSAEYYRRINAGLFGATFLHIFVLTLECNLSCLYCQAEYSGGGSTNMTRDTASRAVDIALQSPEENLSFEFQGGEPLLNFGTLKFIVEYSSSRRDGRNIRYSLVTNAQAMTDEILGWLSDHDVNICFSLDGPEYIHDSNRPSKNGDSNFANVMRWRERALKVYGVRRKKITTLPTITRNTLPYSRELVDFYSGLGNEYISLRPLSPFGRAGANRAGIGYSPEEFTDFYAKCMDYIISLNLSGSSSLKESFSEMLLQKIFGRYTVNYTDLRSPCGAVTGQLAYNWDGKIYTCDEGRMMANAGIKNFCAGNVFDDSYKSVLLSETACDVCNASCIESNPSCSHCVFSPICGLCPVYSFYTQGDYVGVPLTQERCRILRGIYMYIVDRLLSGSDEERGLLSRWGGC